MRYLRGIYVIWLREVIRFRREPARLIGMVAQPLLYLLLVGNGIAHGFSLRAGGHVNYLGFMFPGIVAMSVLFTSMFSAMSIVWDREFGFLKEVLVSPVPRASIALGKAFGGGTIALLQGAILLLLAPLVGLKLGMGIYFELLAILALLSLALNGLGILVAIRLSTMQGFQVVMNFLVMPLFFLSGALYPLRGMPSWLSDLMKIDPLTYGVDAMRHVVGNSVVQFSLSTDIWIVVLVTVGLVSVATWQFSSAPAS